MDNNRELTQQDGSKTQDGRMTKKCGARLCIPGLARNFFRHSAVLSLTAVLLRKLPNASIRTEITVTSDFHLPKNSGNSG